MNFRKADHSNRSNRQFLLGCIFSWKIILALATNSLRMPQNLQSALTE